MAEQHPDGLTHLEDFHRQARTYLDILDDLAADAREQGTVGRARAVALADFFEGQLVAHDTDEEVLLLPLLRKHSDDPTLERLLRVCVNGHEKLETRIDALVPLLRELAEHPETPDAQVLATAAREVRSMLEAHMRLEETSIFPHAREILDDATRRALGRELSLLEEERRTGQRRVREV